MNTHYRYIILGGGIVGGYAAKSFVQHGLQPGELLILSADDLLPYDRTALSKSYLKGEKSDEKILLNPPEFYETHGIEVALNCLVTRADLGAKRLTLRDGREVQFDKLLIATGSKINRLGIPGSNLDGLYYLHWRAESRAIRAAVEAGAKRAVVIGGGYIAMEASAVLAEKGVDTTVVVRSSRMMDSHFFTPEISAFFRRYFEARGVKFVMGAQIGWFSGNGHISSAALTTGEELPADMIIAGVGVTPAAELFEKSGVEVDRGILVNEFLETRVPDVWAAGDVIRFPDRLFERTRHIEHWDNAVESGKHAARLMATGSREPYNYLPYFFSDMFDLSYEFWGDSAGFTEVVYRGNVDSGSFSAWWLKGERVIASFVMARPNEERDFAQQAIRDRASVSPDRLKNENISLAEARSQ